MDRNPIVEIREPGRAVRRLVLDQPIEVGRECDGENLADPGVSRRHLRLVPTPTGLSLVDLESRNGTLLNGVEVRGRVVLEPGDVVRLGNSEIVMVGRTERVAAPSRATSLVSGADLPVPPPPAPPVAPSPRPAAAVLVDRVLGRYPRRGETVFPVSTEMRTRVPIGVWHAVRIGSVLLYVALCVALFVAPSTGLFWFFGVIVPLLPILFFTAPGLWRNICPLAASNQAPRVLGFTRGGTVPEWLRRRGYLVAITLFFGITGARLAIFNVNGAATGILLSITIVNALLAGFFFKGKSGWCSSICPLLPLQRVYGQTPFAKVPNSHCQPCVACTKNCYDFQPAAAYQADLHEPDPEWTAPRRLFVGALPGFVLGFFVLVGQHSLPLGSIYGQLALFFLGSIGLFFAAQALFPHRPALIVAIWAAVAIDTFYWFAGVTLAGSFATLTGLAAPWLRWPIFVVVVLLSLLWIARTVIKSRQYESEIGAVLGRPLPLVEVERPAPPAGSSETGDDAVEVRVDDGAPVSVSEGTSLLEVAEQQGLPIEAGCRMGVCGADPVAVLGGGDCLAPAEEEEANTLRRLGLGASTRMACCARVQGSGSVTMSLTPEPGGPDDAETPQDYDRSIVSVVVLGNGIAGVTAADFLRRGHPDCEIHLVGQESHVLYNRMGISRLVYGRSAMQGLYLLPEEWYDEHGVTAWLNTVATRIDLRARRVHLGTGDTIPYDRLVIATGSSSAVPPLDRADRPGSFVLRSAADAIAVRAYVQQRRCRDAVVSGGGLLGLEAAHALHELGLRVTVLERGARLLSKQIDETASALAHAHFAGLGMHVLYRGEAKDLDGDDRVTGVALADGRVLSCDVYVAAVGIRPNSGLAADAGVAVKRGVLVDDRMETDVPGVFAVGDVAEHGGRVLGLWPIAAKQGEVAAVNALGGDERLVAEVPATILKGVDLDLFSVGRFEPETGDEVLSDLDPAEPSYRKLVVADGRAVGAIVVGHHPAVVAALSTAVRQGSVLAPDVLAAVRGGDWEALSARRRPAVSSLPSA
ncbi:FAD-dependent oxidoreductase [Actinomycetospora chiangmaiensis]|uniref:FAD-dependent oxidoreductase n=1 Tax=Actinomycetospora chiangmaiensis TaxID=402650 RepID=UPI00036E2308|nr:FAD-dependent oxidoreductase [Actinomycetospora chiangmaiensis]